MNPTRSTRSTPRAPAARRATLCLSLSVLMLAGLAGCDRPSSKAGDGRSTTTTTPAASAASR